MKQEREKWIDALRGLAMLLVIWGHCGKNIFFNAIYLVNVPLFICITGYINGMKFYEKEEISKADYFSIIRHYVYPYLTYGLLFEICSYINGLLGLRLFGTINDARFSSIFLNFITFEAGTIWFLIPLAIAEIMYYIILTSLNIIWKRNVNPITKSLFISLLAIGLVGMVDLINPQRLFPQLDGTIMTCMKHWYYLLKRSFAFIFYLALGYFCYYIIKNKLLGYGKQVIICCICVAIFCVNYTSEAWAFTEVRNLSDYNQLKYFFLSVAICIPLFLVFSHFGNHLSLLQHIGRNTLIINGTHLTFNIVEICSRWCGRCLHFFKSQIVLTLVFMMLTTLIEIIIIVPIFHGSLRFMDKPEVFREILKREKRFTI